MTIGIRHISARSGTGANYNNTITVAADETPCMAFVHLYAGYSVLGGADMLLDGVAVSALYYQSYGQGYQRVWASPLISTPGSHTFNLSGIGTGYTSTGSCFLVTQTSGFLSWQKDIAMGTTQQSYSYTLLAGLFLLEITANRSAAGSGQVALASSNGVMYRNSGMSPGPYISKVTFSTNGMYGGMEMLPSGKICDVLPVMIG